MQAGIIHSFDQSSDLRSTDSVYYFDNSTKKLDSAAQPRPLDAAPILGHLITPRATRSLLKGQPCLKYHSSFVIA